MMPEPAASRVRRRRSFSSGPAPAPRGPRWTGVALAPSVDTGTKPPRFTRPWGVAGRMSASGDRVDSIRRPPKSGPAAIEPRPVRPLTLGRGRCRSRPSAGCPGAC